MPRGERPRRLTPREAARLMGFSKEHLGFDFEITVSDVQAYKQFGNSVVVPQFQWVAERIYDAPATSSLNDWSRRSVNRAGRIEASFATCRDEALSPRPTAPSPPRSDAP